MTSLKNSTNLIGDQMLTIRDTFLKHSFGKRSSNFVGVVLRTPVLKRISVDSSLVTSKHDKVA